MRSRRPGGAVQRFGGGRRRGATSMAELEDEVSQAEPWKTLAAANFFLAKGLEDGVSIDPLKLQKLVYFAHGWHLAVTGKPLIDEYVEAWPYGPVIPSLYHRFKSYGADPITDLVYVRGPTGELYPPLPTHTETPSRLNKV